MQNFRYALTLAQMLYDIEISDEDDAIEIGLVAYNFIGNKRTRLVKDSLEVNCADGSIHLPCGVDLIESVTYCGLEDWNYSSNIKEFGDLASSYTENYIESRKAFLNPFYQSGRFVKYKRVGDTLYVNKGLGRVNILYQQELLDEDGLPYINDKEAIAIADYIAYTFKYKEGIRTQSQSVMAIAKDIKQQWLFHCDAARVPEYVNQNEMDSILNVQSSHNRKVYNRSYKPVM